MVTAVDTETCRFGPGLKAPELVCVSHAARGQAPGLLDAEAGVKYIKNLLSSGTKTAFHNASYDLCVFGAADVSLMPLLFEASEKGLVDCTRLREEIIAIAAGDFTFKATTRGFSLASVSERRLGVRPEKGAVRTSFAQLRGVNLSEWPAEHVEYAKLDAVLTESVWQDQEKDRMDPEHGDLLSTQSEQVSASFSLQLASCWGMRTDGAKVAELKAEYLKKKEILDERFRKLGVLRSDGTKDKKVLASLVEKAYEGNPPRTPKGGISTAKTTLEESGDEDLEELAGGGRVTIFLSTYIPALEAATKHPLNPGFMTLKETGRTGCAEPNIQNFPKKGGVRECFIPRPGWKYVGVDYATLELRTLAQAKLDLFGSSTIADALIDAHVNGGADLHARLAATLAGQSIEEFMNRFKAREESALKLRDTAKIPNFGLPGGMRAKTFQKHAKKAGLELTMDQSEFICDAWLKTWPDMETYFTCIETLLGVDQGGGYKRVDRDASIKLPRDGLVRRGFRTLNAAYNFPFQGTAARGAKAALVEVSKRCYTVRGSDLFNSRPVAFVHDEIVIESPEGRAAAAKAELEEVMIQQMRRFVPDIPITVDGRIMDRWAK